MRVIYFGTPDFAVPSLAALMAAHDVVGVVTQPDKPRGRGHQVSFSPVKQLAVQHGVRVMQPARLRDTAWLAATGFAATGYDASPGLLAEARRRYPALRFEVAALPALDKLPEDSFTNVLCETVIMHLPAPAIAPSVRRLMAILEPGGTLYLSWRVTAGADRRDAHGRLYTAFDPALVFKGLGAAEILLDEAANNESSGKLVRRIVARKGVREST